MSEAHDVPLPETEDEAEDLDAVALSALCACEAE